MLYLAFVNYDIHQTFSWLTVQWFITVIAHKLDIYCLGSIAVVTGFLSIISNLSRICSAYDRWASFNILSSVVQAISNPKQTLASLQSCISNFFECFLSALAILANLLPVMAINKSSTQRVINWTLPLGFSLNPLPKRWFRSVKRLLQLTDEICFFCIMKTFRQSYSDFFFKVTVEKRGWGPLGEAPSF